MQRPNSISDYAIYILFRLTAVFLRLLPVGVSFFIGRRVGELFYLFDLKHRALAYANLKVAFGKEYSPSTLRAITFDFYRTFGQNFIEIFLLSVIDKAYLKRYVVVEGLENISQALQKGRGLILVAVHAGGWELSNTVCANLGFNFNMFVREQPRYPLLENLLNSYRVQKGCKLIQRSSQTRRLI
ncbi:MAG: hypothetical protein NC923_06060, partial [Candidatus Omnitrophica bacterium]|nr:hypothetical protein [Candidatus Omnitrophota bacterium]